MTSCDFKSQKREINLTFATKDLVLLTIKSWIVNSHLPTNYVLLVGFLKILHIKEM
jgi:hypothetical protein